MNYRPLFLVGSFALCAWSALAQSGIGLRPGENLYAYQARMEAYFAPEIASRGVGALVGEEGGEYNEYLKFMRFWEPRLYPSGDFARYYQLESNFYNRYNHPRRRVVANALTVTATGTITNTAPWQEIGPTNRPSGFSAGTGPVEFLLFYNPDPLHMLCGSTAGGLFYSSNGGASWSKTGTDTQIGRSGVGTAAFHPSDYRTWFAASSGNSGHNDSASIGLTGGIFRTNDEGLTWSQIAFSSQLGDMYSAINKLVIDPQNANHLWAATSSGLYVTNNAMAPSGTTWVSVLPNVLVYDLELRPGDPKWVYATIQDAGVWRFVNSNNTGSTWNDVPGLPSTAGANALTIEVTPTKPENLYCLIARKEGCWNHLGNVDGTSELYIYDFGANTATRVTGAACISMGGGNAFGVDPFNPSKIFLSHDTEGRRYTYGATPPYVQYNSTYHGGTYHPDIEALVPHPHNANEVWMCHHGGVSVSTDNGATWTDRSKGIGVAQVFGMADAASDPGYVAIGLYHDGTVLTAPPWYEQWSPSWKWVAPGDGLRPMIAPTTPQYMWATYPGDFWERSVDFGASFSGNGPISPGWSNGAAVFNHLSPNIQYRIAADQTIRRTTDWGSTWPSSPISDFQAVYPSATYKSISLGKLYAPRTNGDVLVVALISTPKIGDAQDHLFRTKKANDAPADIITSWVELPLPMKPRIGDIEFDPSNPDILYISNFYSSSPPTDLTGTDLVIRADYTDLKHPVFTDLTQNLPNATTGIDSLAIAADGTGGLYYVCDFGSFYSSEATRATGKGWTPFGAGLPHTSFNGLEINDVNRKVRAASFGRGVWEHDLAATISGRVFHDLNHNGSPDTGEPSLAGWTVTLASDTGDTATTATDANGRYTFSALAAGRYQITEGVPKDWAQTLPAAGRYFVQLAAGQLSAGLDFGNDVSSRATCVPPPSDMTAWWTFNEKAGGATAHDDAGFDNAGTRVGNPSLVEGKVASAFHFDGSTQYIQAASQPELNVDAGDFSIQAWVRTSSKGPHVIVDKRSDPPLGYSFVIFDGRLGFQMADRSGSQICSMNNSVSACTNWYAPVGSPSVADGQWHHVAVTVDRDNPAGGVLYIDGAPVTSFDPTIRNRSLANNGPLRIAADGGGTLWNGEIDEVALFKRALSPYDIQSAVKADKLGQCSCKSECLTSSLSGGKVVFSSNRVTPPQLFVQQVGATTAPRKLTDDFFGARNPKWSPDGNYVAYIRGDSITGGEVSDDDELTVIDDSATPLNRVFIHADKFDARNLGYPQWSANGKSIVVLFTRPSGARGLGLIQFPFPSFSSPVVTTLLVGDSSLNPGEPVFSLDGGTIYFAADTPSAPSALFSISVTGGVPGPVMPVIDQYGTQVRRFFAPSLSPDGARLMFNSEMWKENADYQDEEILELDLASGVIKRITAEPDNQYGFFAKNGHGEFLLQSNNTATHNYALYLQSNGTRIPLDIGDPQNQWNESGDWWKSP